MITVFIFFNDLNSLIFLSNKIAQVNNNLKLIGLDNKISKSSISQCLEMKPNIIISNKNFTKKISKKLNFEYISIEFDDLENIEKLLNQLSNLCMNTYNYNKLQANNLRKNIHIQLQNLNFNTNLIGTTYLLDFIVLAHELPRPCINSKYTKELVSLISKKYNTSVNSIMWNIHTSIEDMYNSSNEIFRKKIYGTSSKLNYINILKTITNLY